MPETSLWTLFSLIVLLLPSVHVLATVRWVLQVRGLGSVYVSYRWSLMELSSNRILLAADCSFSNHDISPNNIFSCISNLWHLQSLVNLVVQNSMSLWDRAATVLLWKCVLQEGWQVGDSGGRWGPEEALPWLLMNMWLPEFLWWTLSVSSERLVLVLNSSKQDLGT